MRHYKAQVRALKQNEKMAERERARFEASQYENYIQLLLSIHKDCGEIWNWNELLHAPPPAEPQPSQRHEVAARRALAAYSPGFFERLFGGAKNRMARLQGDLRRASAKDASENDAAITTFRAEQKLWNAQRRLAVAMNQRNPKAYSEVLAHAAPFDELKSFGMQVTVMASGPDVVALVGQILDGEIIPTDEVKLTAAGKLSSKEMPPGRYWAMFQDHVCGAAIRLARETFAVLPISRVIVNIRRNQLNTVTGHDEPATILAVHFLRQALGRLNFDTIDPSDSMKNFSFRMKFKKTSGFEPVDPITTEEQWVTT